MTRRVYAVQTTDQIGEDAPTTGQISQDVETAYPYGELTMLEGGQVVKFYCFNVERITGNVTYCTVLGSPDDEWVSEGDTQSVTWYPYV